MVIKFRYKPSFPVNYARQGYIFFKSLRYKDLPIKEQMRIRKLCTTVGGNNGDALFEHVTTGASVKAVCMKYYIASPTTIYRALSRYYERFPDDL